MGEEFATKSTSVDNGHENNPIYLPPLFLFAFYLLNFDCILVIIWISCIKLGPQDDDEVRKVEKKTNECNEYFVSNTESL